MRNAHLRLGRLEYVRHTDKIQTRIEVHVERYMGEGEQGHLLSVYGRDAEVGAIAAAVQEKHAFTLIFPAGKTQKVAMREDAVCFRAAVSLPGQKHVLRHLVCVSASLQGNGTAGKTFLLNYDRTRAWATLASLTGLPSVPGWGNFVFDQLETDGMLVELDGIGCNPVAVVATRESLLERIGKGLEARGIAFPEKNGPILWPSFRPQDALRTEVAQI